MNRILHGWRTWRLLTQTQRAQWLQSWALLPLVSVGLRVFGMGRVQAVLYRSVRKTLSRKELHESIAIAEIFYSAVRWSILSATCLAQSLVLCWLLRRYGLEAELRIGVTRPNGQLAAHAWVEHGGVALEEGNLNSQFLPFHRAIVSPRNGSL